MDQEEVDKTILVSGATGLVGSHLLRYLYQRGYRQLRAIRRPNSDLSLLGSLQEHIEWYDGDLHDIPMLEKAMKDVSVVFHCAGLVSFHPADRDQLLKTNVIGTANMVNIALYRQVAHFIHVSSIAALGRSKEGQTIDESIHWERSPYNTRYGISKFQAEQEVWRGYAEGLPVAILNPSIILGGGEWDKGPARFFKMIARGLHFYPLGNSGFVDVRDVAQLLYLLMQKGITGRRFIANAGHYSYHDFFQFIARTMGKRPPTIPVRPWLAAFAWRAASLQARLTGRRSLLTRETATQAGRTFYYDNTRSKEELDFTYRSLEETIRQTALLYEACKQHKQLMPGFQPLPF